PAPSSRGASAPGAGRTPNPQSPGREPRARERDALVLAPLDAARSGSRSASSARRLRRRECVVRSLRLGPWLYSDAMKPWRCALLVVALGCSSPSLPRLPASQGPRYFGNVRVPAGETFTYNNGAEPESIDPGLISGQPDGRVARTIFEGLTTPDPKTLVPEPGQAYRWDVSPDGMTYTF